MNSISTFCTSPAFREVLSAHLSRLATLQSLLCAYRMSVKYDVLRWRIFLLHGGAWSAHRKTAGGNENDRIWPGTSLATRTLILKILLIWKPSNTNFHYDGSVYLLQEIALCNYLFFSLCFSLLKILVTGDILCLSFSERLISFDRLWREKACCVHAKEPSVFL